MTNWIFKVSDQGTYADVPGKTYVYDNTHSVRVSVGDEFIYLAKTGSKYGLTGAGCISKLTSREAKPDELHSPRVTRVFEASLKDVVWFVQPFDISSQTKSGLANRRSAGLPLDVNRIGWSLSMPRVDRELFVRLLDAAIGLQPPPEGAIVNPKDGHVDDAWSLVRQRCRMQAFRAAVLNRHNYTCLICGTRLRSVLDAAHLRRYSSYPDHRADPKNGICLCKYCHGAFDWGDITLFADGRIKVKPEIQDDIARVHFGTVDQKTRQGWLAGVETSFLAERSLPVVS